MRTALFVDKTMAKMPWRVSFIWCWKTRLLTYTSPCWICWHEFDKLIFKYFCIHIETHSENKYRCDTLNHPITHVRDATFYWSKIKSLYRCRIKIFLKGIATEVCTLSTSKQKDRPWNDKTNQTKWRNATHLLFI